MLKRILVFTLSLMSAQVGATENLSDRQCLASAIYHESRGEPVKGQLAVAEVIFNRMRTRGLSLCEVVLQSKQFSFVAENTKWLSVEEAEKFLGKLGNKFRVIGRCATHYHRSDIKPSWAERLVELALIGNHVFYGRAKCILRHM
jgi:spore germination cell wall hydrolase CwlJ-like protein